MRILIASTFISLDGVMQAPGGPTEDPTGDFTLGGWLYAFGDASMDISAAGFDGKDKELYSAERLIKYSKRTGLTNQKITQLQKLLMQQKNM